MVQFKNKYAKDTFDKLEPKVADAFLADLEPLGDLGAKVMVTEGWRSPEQMKKYGSKTTKHKDGLAIDLREWNLTQPEQDKLLSHLNSTGRWKAEYHGEGTATHLHIEWTGD